MTEPIVTPDDLGTYLNDPNLNEARATALIADAQTLCESIVSPLPATAALVVKRVAGRAYVSSASTRNPQIAAAGSTFGQVSGGLGGVWLSRSDKADLRRINGGGGAFSIDMLPAGYVAPTTGWVDGSGFMDDWDTPA